MSKPPETPTARGLGEEFDEATGGAYRQRRLSLWIWLGLLVAAAAMLAYLASTPRTPLENRGPSFPGVGVELSTIRFDPLTGDPPPIRKEDLQGRVAVINFWGPWCPGCRMEMPHLLQLGEKYGGRDDFRLLLVSNNGQDLDVDALRHDTAEYLKSIGSDHPTYYDPYFQTLAALSREGRLPNVAFPMTVVLDRQGVLRGVWIGYTPGEEEMVEDLVQELLE
jgi:thiol-disulfide isomerase/thioredoxin